MRMRMRMRMRWMHLFSLDAIVDANAIVDAIMIAIVDAIMMWMRMRMRLKDQRIRIQTSSHLYKRVCQSIRLSVRRSHGPSVPLS